MRKKLFTYIVGLVSILLVGLVYFFNNNNNFMPKPKNEYESNQISSLKNTPDNLKFDTSDMNIIEMKQNYENAELSIKVIEATLSKKLFNIPKVSKEEYLYDNIEMDENNTLLGDNFYLTIELELKNNSTEPFVFFRNSATILSNQKEKFPTQEAMLSNPFSKDGTILLDSGVDKTIFLAFVVDEKSLKSVNNEIFFMVDSKGQIFGESNQLYKVKIVTRWLEEWEMYLKLS